MHRSRVLARIGVGFLFVVVLAAVGFVVWAQSASPAMPEALAALKSDERVTVTEGDGWTTFKPLGVETTGGLILYPGGRVDWRAYAPAARELAACGNFVAIVPMPLNLAIFGKDSAARVMAAHPEIQTWTVGGHSLGGAMAAQFAHDHPGQVRGLLLWAAYPAGNASLADTSIRVLSVSGTLDGLATPDKIEGSRALLPAKTEWLAIEGGNHAGFGWYGAQAGDNPSTITREEQQRTIVEAGCGFLEEARKK